jgi:transcription elongation factor Elf1
MVRKRKKIAKYMKKSLPELYLCPHCGMNTIQININKKINDARIICSSCDLRSSININPNIEKIDAYCKFFDNF